MTETSNLQDFVRVLAHFRPIKKNVEKNKLNTRMEKLHFAFRMYDLDGDDKISKVCSFQIILFVIEKYMVIMSKIGSK